jgi:hypothetical protein
MADLAIRLSIGLPTFVRASSPNTHIHFVTTFHRRRLPHYYSAGQATFFTWRLHGSLPANRSFPPAIASGQAFRAMDRILDSASAGPLFLRMPEVAKMVMEAIHYRDQRTCEVHSFVIMPNHVHLLMTPFEAVSKVMQSLKRFTATEGNRMCWDSLAGHSGRTRALTGWFATMRSLSESLTTSRGTR